MATGAKSRSVTPDRPKRKKTGGGAPRTQAHVIRRRRYVEDLMLIDASRERIFELVRARFPVVERIIERDMTFIRSAWRDVDEAGRPERLRLARARLLDDVGQARKAGEWSAVAALERVLSRVERTEPPPATHQTAVQVNVGMTASAPSAAPLDQWPADLVELARPHLEALRSLREEVTRRLAGPPPLPPRAGTGHASDG